MIPCSIYLSQFGLFHLAESCQDSQMAGYFFSWLDNVPFCVCIYIYISHNFLGTQVVYISWPLWIMLQQTWGCISLDIPTSEIVISYGSSREFEWALGDGDGQGGLACCNSWGRKELDTTEWLNWTELHHFNIIPNVFFVLWVVVWGYQQKVEHRPELFLKQDWVR